MLDKPASAPPPPEYYPGNVPHVEGQPMPFAEPVLPNQIPPPQIQQGPGIIAVTPTVVMSQGQMPLGPFPQHLVCPACNTQITTKTRSEVSALAWIVGVVLCAVGLVLCSCIPCCLDSMKDTHHTCPACHHYLGKHKAG